MGKADTVAGEIVRAISRIGFRYYNDGDLLGVGYGKETCNPAGRYLMKNCDENIKNLVSNLWGNEYDYTDGLANLEEAVLSYIEQRPELQEMENKEDMLKYRNEEDVDNDSDFFDDEEE